MISPLPELAELEATWRDLEARSEPTFFTSWAWIGTWLETLPSDLRPRIVRVMATGRTIGLAVLCRRTVARGGIIRSDSVFLNSTGYPRFDEITIQYNDFLVEAGCAEQVARGFMRELLRDPRWDELHVAGLWRVELLEQLACDSLQVLPIVRPEYFVDLAALRARDARYLPSLPKKIRSQLRRLLNEYGEAGLAFEIATSLHEAESFMGQLKELHTKAWRARGKPGAFANEHLDAFHKALIRKNFGSGAIQISRLRVGVRPVGYLYCFVHGGSVYVYQSGFDWEFDSRTWWRPGLLCHYFAIEASQALGLAAYRFMAGDQQYKRQMATAESKMFWVSWRRPRLKFRIEARLRALRAMARRDQP